MLCNYTIVILEALGLAAFGHGNTKNFYGDHYRAKLDKLQLSIHLFLQYVGYQLHILCILDNDGVSELKM